MIEVIPGLRSTSAALDAERVRMDIVGQNLANVHTTRGPDGKPYERQQVIFESVLRQATGDQGATPPELRVARVQGDGRAPKLVYMPGHPDANAEGMVAMPDINVAEEMVDLIASSRVFEANLAVVKNSRSMALQTLAIGKRA
jgi:flagellar basal-body rod protein FlgC